MAGILRGVLCSGLIFFASELGMAEDVFSARTLLNRAIDDATERLERSSCVQLFGSSAVRLLQTADYRLLPLGPPHYRGNRPAVRVAFTVSDRHMVMINLDGPFVNPRLPLLGTTRFFNLIDSRRNGAVVLSDNDFRALILLHELGHLTGTFEPEMGDVDKSRGNTATVMQHCFD